MADNTRRGKLKAGFRSTLSPPVWKDQLKKRCMQRLKDNRRAILDKLRSPDANIAQEMRMLIGKEHRESVKKCSDRRRHAAGRGRHPVFDFQSDSTGADVDEDMPVDELSCFSIEELLERGNLSEDDYLDIVHSLEDEVRREMDAEYEEMLEFEDAQLAAMLEGIDLDHEVDPAFDDASISPEG